MLMLHKRTNPCIVLFQSTSLLFHLAASCKLCDNVVYSYDRIIFGVGSASLALQNAEYILKSTNGKGVVLDCLISAHNCHCLVCSFVLRVRLKDFEASFLNLAAASRSRMVV